MIRTDLALVIITAIILAFNLVPPTMAIVFGDVTLFSAVFGGFLLPGTFLYPFLRYEKSNPR